MQLRYETKATKDDLIKAFSSTSLLRPVEIAQLKLHYSQPSHEATPTFLGQMMGEKSHQGASSRNVAMAKKISRHLSILPPLREDGSSRWWAFLVFAEKDGRHWKLQLKPEVVAALEQLGWKQLPVLPESLVSEDFRRQVTTSQADSPEARRKRLESSPKKSTVVQVARCEFRRNADVVAEILFRADGRCESCGHDAPFIRASDGTPYLEVHHVVPLAEGGDDTVENAIALCPNCHCERHFG